MLKMRHYSQLVNNIFNYIYKEDGQYIRQLKWQFQALPVLQWTHTSF